MTPIEKDRPITEERLSVIVNDIVTNVVTDVVTDVVTKTMTQIVTKIVNEAVERSADETITTILEAMGSYAMQVNERFDAIETDIACIKADMVTKSYLDDKMASQRGELIEMLRAEDHKV